MAVTIRRIAAASKWCQEVQSVSMQVVADVIPPTVVRAAAATARHPGGRMRKLSLELVLWLLISLALFPQEPLPSVLRKVTHGVWLLWPSAAAAQAALASGSALVYRRRQLGVRPLRQVQQAVCQPLAEPTTLPSAFAFGLRVVALDGTVENLPDTLANQRVFGRRASQRGRSAYPQALGVVLVECATHAVFAAEWWPATTSEHRAAPRLLRALRPQMLVLWDRGFHSVGLIRVVQARGAHMVGRLPAHVRPQVVATLPDGSALVRLRPGGAGRADPTAALLVRLVTYHLRPAPTGRMQRYRLVTTLLDPCQAPAAEVAALYHQRWAVEQCFGEIDTRLRLSARSVRSRTPRGVMQELYGMLLAHYAIRALMYRAALASQQLPSRLSFVAGLRLVCEALPDYHMLPTRQWPQRTARLLHDVAQARLPTRRLRTNPRVVKRRTVKYPQKRSDHHGVTHQTHRYADWIVVLPVENVI